MTADPEELVSLREENERLRLTHEYDEALFRSLKATNDEAAAERGELLERIEELKDLKRQWKTAHGKSRAELSELQAFHTRMCEELRAALDSGTALPVELVAQANKWRGLARGLANEVETLRHDVCVLEGMLHSEQDRKDLLQSSLDESQEIVADLKREVRRLKGEGRCLHCGGPSKLEYCSDACEECHESGDWKTGYDPRVEDYLMTCESNICGKSRTL